MQKGKKKRDFIVPHVEAFELMCHEPWQCHRLLDLDQYVHKDRQQGSACLDHQ